VFSKSECCKLLRKKNKYWDSGDVCTDAPKELDGEELRELERLKRWIREEQRKIMKTRMRRATDNVKEPEKKLEDDKPLPVIQERLEDFY